MKPPRRNPTARPSALERLERRLDTARHGSNAEIIRLMRVAMFADVDELEASGTVKLPEPTHTTPTGPCCRPAPGLRPSLRHGRDAGAERQLRPAFQSMIP